jgi:alpha,alpha-trehalose phosphorylase
VIAQHPPEEYLRSGLLLAYRWLSHYSQQAIHDRGLAGPGYDRHAFWDSDMFVLPVLMLALPHAAADVLANHPW